MRPTCWTACLLCRQTCSWDVDWPRPAGSPPCTQTDQFLVSILPGDRWAREGTLSRCPWRGPAVRSNTWRRGSIWQWRCIESVPKTSSLAGSAAQSWKRDRWRRSQSCSSSGHPTPSEQRGANRGPAASNWSARVVSQWRLSADWCRSGKLCSTQACEQYQKKLNWIIQMIVQKCFKTYENLAQSYSAFMKSSICSTEGVSRNKEILYWSKASGFSLIYFSSLKKKRSLYSGICFN